MGPPSRTTQSFVHSSSSLQHLWTMTMIWWCRQGFWNGTEHTSFPSRHRRVSGWPPTQVHLTLSLAKGSWEQLLVVLLRSSTVLSLALQTRPLTRETGWLYDPRNDHGPEILWLPKCIIQPPVVPKDTHEHIIGWIVEVDLNFWSYFWSTGNSQGNEH